MIKNTIKIPHRVKIGGHDYKVRWDEGARSELERNNWRGSSSTATREIKLRQGVYSDQDMSCTFLHEVVHCIDDIYCNTHMAEDDVDAISNGIHQVLEQVGVRFTR